MHDGIKTFRVGSVEEFVELACRIRQEWSSADGQHFNPWFRGQLNAGWGLRPSIYRLELGWHEGDIRASYKRQGSLLITERVPASDWEWYFLMQHYGAPTRLLDWSDGALLALYFALSPPRAGNPRVGANAAVWMLDPYWLNERTVKVDGVLTTDSKEAAAYLPPTQGGRVRKRFPIAIGPPHIARRLGVQRSKFTIHGTDEEGLLELGRPAGSRLVQIVIRKPAIERMRNDLGTCGVWDTTVFPDLEGLSREIIRDWTDTWTPD